MGCVDVCKCCGHEMLCFGDRPAGSDRTMDDSSDVANGVEVLDIFPADSFCVARDGCDVDYVF